MRQNHHCSRAESREVDFDPCQLPHSASQRCGTLSGTTHEGERCMHGFHASSERELPSEPESPTRWSPEWNFGLIAVIVLSALAIAAAPLAPIVISP
jgi:hypothetical protein